MVLTQEVLQMFLVTTEIGLNIMNVSLFEIENVYNNLVAFQVAFDLFFLGWWGVTIHVFYSV